MKRFWYILGAGVTTVVIFAGLKLTEPQLEGVTKGASEFPQLSSFPTRNANVADPDIRAKYAILLDQDGFYPLYKKGAFASVPIASTTKMMTALISLDQYGLDEVVTVSREATLQIGSDTGLLPGEAITVRSLLHALLIQSGNDAAYALAEHGGGVEDFVNRMNAKAAEIGMGATLFRDPAGLDDSGHSTSFDLAVLAAMLIENKTAREITKIPETTISSTDGKQSHLLKNSNRLVTPELFFPGAFGIKTGFTPGAGHTLVAAAERNGKTLISVILATYEDSKEASARESSKLLSWGFENHTWINP